MLALPFNFRSFCSKRLKKTKLSLQKSSKSIRLKNHFSGPLKNVKHHSKQYFQLPFDSKNAGIGLPIKWKQNILVKLAFQHLPFSIEFKRTSGTKTNFQFR
jgi:hypothetical protein